jgi:hypothetical protein
MTDLEDAFGANVCADKQNGKFKNIDLQMILRQNPAGPTFILQPSFEHANLKDTFLRNIGVNNVVIPQIPSFSAFRPDIVWVQTRRDDEVEVLPNGDTCTIQAGDQRRALLICDIKHAGEANSSYSSEVTLYAILLANWLQLTNLHGTYLVASRVALWTRAKEVSSLAELIVTNPGATISEKIQAFENDLEPIDFPIFFQTIDHFFKTDLPRVLAEPDWAQLDWHVDSRCSSCDFLGYRNWLSPNDRTTLDAQRDHYCVSAAEDSQHLSRIATITRGSRKTLEISGYADIPAVSALLPIAPVFDMHNALKADRKHLPHRAAALIAGDVTIAPNTTTIDFPKWADLEIFITVNFDPGTGLLSAIGFEGRFRQRAPFGQQSQVNRTWPAEAHTLLSATLDEERNVIISFLTRLAEMFSFAYDTNPQRGGPDAARTQTQLYFWDRRQFEELSKAIGRHINVIVMPQNDPILRGLIWLFPPEQTLQDDELTLANAVTFLKAVIQRDLRLPVSHCLTIFNVAEAYHNPQYPPHVPGSFYRDPFSDMIPRERIYEIWSGEPLVRIGTVQKTRSQCITDYSNAINSQIKAIRNIAWKFRTDMTDRLNFAARHLDIGIPFNFQSMSEDGRLWYGWARLEEAYKKIELRRTWAEEPEQLEASYDILRFSNLIAQANNDFTYQVRPSSRDCKFRDTEGFLAIQDESIPGFLDLRLRDIASPAMCNSLSFRDQNSIMANIYQAELLEYDRINLRARVRLTDFGNAPALRLLLDQNGLVNLNTSTSLVSGPGPSMSDRIRNCLTSIGRPPIAIASTTTYQALGHALGVNPPRNDTVTPAAQVLWDAGSLAVQNTNTTAEAVQATVEQIINAHWPCNQSQRSAIEHCLQRRLSIVWGPPGTGKTTTAAALIVARILIAQTTGQNLRMLIIGPTYNAWEKLFNDTLTLLRQFNVPNLTCFRVYSSSHQTQAPLPENTIPVTDVTASNQDPNFNELTQHLDVPNGIILVGTVAQQCYRIAEQSHRVAQHPFFDFAVFDESSQLDIGKALFPLCLLTDSSEISFFGDHLQMPPIILTQPPCEAEWLVGSIQTYLIRRHHCVQQPLLTNYRAARPFVEFGKRIGYPLNLNAHSPNLQLHLLNNITTQPPDWNATVLWFSGLLQITDPARCLTAITYEDGRAGQANDFEADLVCSMIQQIYTNFSQSLDGELDANGNPSIPQHAPYTPDAFWDFGIGIVTPHRAQRAVIVRRLRQIFPMHPVEKIDASVDTVERFQGGQRDTIIISFGVGDPDLIADEEEFLLQLERTNVAISRARAKCILVISDDLAYHLPSERETIKTSKAVKSYVSDFCRQTQPINVPISGGTTRPILLRWH